MSLSGSSDVSESTPGRPRITVPMDACLVVRTDYRDDGAWNQLVERLTSISPSDEVPLHLFEDPAWANAEPEEVLAAVPDDDTQPAAVFIADAHALRAEANPVLAGYLNPFDLDDEDYEGLPDGVSAWLRVEADAAVMMNVLIDQGTTDWEDYARRATENGGVVKAVW